MLRKYTEADFELLSNWITDAEIQFRFSGPDWQYPLTREVLDEYMASHPQRQFYISSLESDEPYAFGEIINGDANSPRLGRLLVKEGHRGKGLGQLFVKELLVECIRVLQPKEIYLYVFENNIAGIRCYEKCGFEFTGDRHGLADLEGQPLNVLKMKYLV